MKQEEIEKIEQYLETFQPDLWLRKTLLNNATVLAETLETELFRMRVQDNEIPHAGILELAKVTNETVSNFLTYERQYTRRDKYERASVQ